MIYSSKDMESRAVLDTAAKICAARAPRRKPEAGRPRDCVLTGEVKASCHADAKLADGLIMRSLP